jgi:hypothetical protein
MKVPVWCPVCGEMPLELLYVAHQHLACRYCGQEFCAVCVDPAVIARSVHEWRMRQVAALN